VVFSFVTSLGLQNLERKIDQLSDDLWFERVVSDEFSDLTLRFLVDLAKSSAEDPEQFVSKWREWTKHDMEDARSRLGSYGRASNPDRLVRMYRLLDAYLSRSLESEQRSPPGAP